MRILLTFTAIMAIAAIGRGQTLNVEVGSVTYVYPAAQAGEMLYSNSNAVTILGKTYLLEDISRMYVSTEEVTQNTVSVQYDGNEAHVVVAGNIAQYVEPLIQGAHVSIIQSGDVGENTCGEITYELSGESGNGQFYLAGNYKSRVELHGLDLTNLTGSPLDIQNGKRIELSLKENTNNRFADSPGSGQKGCVVCKGHLELKGKGAMQVYGYAGHAIYAKEYIEMKNCTVNVYSAKKDGINCNQYFLMESGTLNITGVEDDGIQVSYKDDADREADDTGNFTVIDGTVNVAVTAKAAKAVKADGDMLISGGTFSLMTSGSGEWDAEELKTKGAACLSADGDINICGGAFVMNSTGSGGKGINCDSDFTITAGDLTITTAGGIYAYVSGQEYDGYTGNTDRMDSNYKSLPKGIKADGHITVNGGSINVTTQGNGGEGIESKKELRVNGGTVLVNSYDDGLNSASHMYINGGDVTSVASNNDGLDSNGNMYLNGGTVRAFGSSGPETGLDANDEGGYHVYITGGMIIGVGSNSNSVPQSTTDSQCYLTVTGTPQAGDAIVVSDGTATLATFVVPENYKGTSGGTGGRRPGGGGPGGMNGSNGNMLISCSGLESGKSYNVTIGDTPTAASAR